MNEKMLNYEFLHYPANPSSDNGTGGPEEKCRL